MTRVIHTGDTHIGYRQYHSPERRADFLDAFEQVVDDAISEGVDAVVHAGDLFHDRRPDLPDLLGTLSALRRLADADVPFLAVVGNHESTRGGQWLDLFERLGLAVRLGREPHVVGDTAFYGLDHVPKSRRDDLEYQFEPHDAEHAALVAHGLFTPFAHADWETETVLREATVSFDAMLLGDNHAADTAEVVGTWVTYCGSTERTSASERDGRGYNIVTFGEDGVDIRRRSLDTREFVFVGVNLGPGEGAERVREQVRQHDLDGAVVIVEVTGDGDAVTPASVEEFATEQGALIARVTDRRERESDDELSVTFADPDAAVRERVADLGLSSAALDVDDVVRDADVVDSNVRERVKGRIQDRLDDGLDGFAPASDADSARDEEAEIDGERDSEASDETDDAESEADGADDETDRAADDAESQTTESAERDGSTGENEDARSEGEESKADDDSEESKADGDGQATMEEYL